MTELTKIISAQAEPGYADFQFKLTPGIKRENVIGVRLPILRKIAKEYVKTSDYRSFLSSLPHKYHEENLIHFMLLEGEKDFDYCLNTVEIFLPYIDNWAVCDSKIPKIFYKNKDIIIEKAKEWIASSHDYTCRYGIHILMSLFLDDDFKEEYNQLPASVHREEYYVNMMIAWYFATALAKQWDATIPYIENKVLDRWTHNKTIQKSVESFRITPEQKEYLKTLRIKK